MAQEEASTRWDWADDFAAAQTNTQIQAAPGPGFAIRILGFLVTANAAVNIRIEDEDDLLRLAPFYFTAKQTETGECLIELPENKALEFDSDAAVPHGGALWGDIVAVKQTT